MEDNEIIDEAFVNNNRIHSLTSKRYYKNIVNSNKSKEYRKKTK